MVEAFGYRPGLNAQQAVVEVEERLHRGQTDVVDADLVDYFGSIPHAELMKSLARRIVDKRVLHLIKMWLECSVEETDDRGRKGKSSLTFRKLFTKRKQSAKEHDRACVQATAPS